MRATCASPSPGSTADQRQQAGADRADRIAVDGDAGLGDALDQGEHGSGIGNRESANRESGIGNRGNHRVPPPVTRGTVLSSEHTKGSAFLRHEWATHGRSRAGSDARDDMQPVTLALG